MLGRPLGPGADRLSPCHLLRGRGFCLTCGSSVASTSLSGCFSLKVGWNDSTPGVALGWSFATLFLLQSILVGMIHNMVTVLDWTFPEAEPRQGLGFLFHIQMSNFPARFVEKDNAFVPWLRIDWPYMRGSISGLSILFHRSVSTLSPLPLCLDYCGLRAGLGIR